MNGKRLTRKLEVFTDFAADLGSLSTCKRRSVGCVVVDHALTQVFSVGYNGPPKGLDNDGCRDEHTNCGCVHAEANALVKLHTDREDLMLITTLSPCESCAGLIINSGAIDHVIYRDIYTAEAIDLLHASHITTHHLEITCSDTQTADF